MNFYDRNGVFNLKRCVAYCRVSTNHKDQENSFENQNVYFEREITKNSEYEFAGIYADKGISGTKLNRPQFDRMIYDAGLDVIEVKNNDGDNRKMSKKYVTIPSSTRSPKFDLILVKNTARFARNVLVEDILRDLAKVGVYVKFMDLDKSTENQEDIIFIQIFQTFDEGESRKKSKAVVFGQIEGANRGRINAGHRIYGYNYIKEDNLLKIIPEEAEIIVKIFELYCSGNGMRRLINLLDDEGIKTRDGKKFCRSSIRRILTNEKYIGVSVRKKYDTGLIFNKNSYPKIRDKKDWLIDENTDKIPPIVTKELFDKCNDLLVNRISHINQKGIYKGTTEFAGLLYCSKCENTYISNMDRGRRFYNCSTKKAQGTKGCDCKNISHKTLNDILTTDMYIATKSMSAQAALATYGVLKEVHIKRLSDIPNDKIQQLHERIAAIEEEQELLLNAYMKKLISEKVFEGKQIPLLEEMEKLELSLKAYTMPKNEIVEAIVEIDSAIERMILLKYKTDYSKDEILADIDKIIILPSDQIQVKFKSFIDETKVKTDPELVTITYIN